MKEEQKYTAKEFVKNYLFSMIGILGMTIAIGFVVMGGFFSRQYLSLLKEQKKVAEERVCQHGFAESKTMLEKENARLKAELSSSNEYIARVFLTGK